MPTVKCNVSNCAYWAEGNNCHADTILVEVDQHANEDYDMSASGHFIDEALHKDQANNVAETCCHTFRPNH